MREWKVVDPLGAQPTRVSLEEALNQLERDGWTIFQVVRNADETIGDEVWIVAYRDH